jgi:ubiquitin-conjugating enzyme E2 variant
MTDALGVSAAVLLTTLLCFRFAASLDRLDLPPLALGLALGFLAADAASGLLHWFCDTYFDARAALIGAKLIEPFREHHVDPGALGRHGVLERNGNNCLAALPLLVLALRSLTVSAGLHAPQSWCAGFWTALALTLGITNQIHAWAHAARVPRAVRCLQRAGVLLAPERHAVHHRGGRAYAVVSGWSNAWLDRLVVGLELALGSLGLRPHEPRGQA